MMIFRKHMVVDLQERIIAVHIAVAPMHICSCIGKLTGLVMLYLCKHKIFHDIFKYDLNLYSRMKENKSVSYLKMS